MASASFVLREMHIYDRCGLLHALAALAPLTPPDDPASLMRALRLEDPSADSVAAEQELVLARVRARLLLCSAFPAGAQQLHD